MRRREAPGYLDDNFLDRVRRAYQLALGARSGSAGGMWNAIAKRQSDVHKALTAHDNTQLRGIFANPAATDLFLGADNLCHSVLKGQMPAGEDEKAKALLREAEQLVGEALEFPNPFLGEFGANTDRGVASYRAIQAAYQAWRVRRLLGSKVDASVVEIGGGLGRTLYYLFEKGFRDCTAIDLPIGLVAQACYLGATLGPDKLWLPGDPPNAGAGRIRLLYASDNLPKHSFDIALNVDSLTEMRWYTALHYARWINKQAKAFLSINHDLNYFRVDEVARVAFDMLKCDRYPCPVRPGYIEEVYFLAGDRIQHGRAELAASLQFGSRAWGRRIFRSLRSKTS